jgi:hypothetical protein
MSNKLATKSDNYLFVGYSRETKWYYFYNKAEGKVFVARNGVFMDKEFLSKRVCGSKVQLEELKKHPKMFQHPLIPYKRYKMLYRQILKHQPHVGL